MTLWDHILNALGIKKRIRYPQLPTTHLWQAELNRQMRLFGFPERVTATVVLQKPTGSDPRFEQPYFNSPDGPAQARTVAQKGGIGALFQVVKGLDGDASIISHECLHAVLVTQWGIHGHPVNLPTGVKLEKCLGERGASVWRELFRQEAMR